MSLCHVFETTLKSFVASTQSEGKTLIDSFEANVLETIFELLLNHSLIVTSRTDFTFFKNLVKDCLSSGPISVADLKSLLKKHQQVLKKYIALATRILIREEILNCLDFEAEKIRYKHPHINWIRFKDKYYWQHG